MIPSGLLRFDTLTARLRATAYIEGISYAVLLFVAMPLKYLADMPLPVRVVGSVHGALFIALALLAWRTLRVRRKPLGFGLRIAIAALVPLGTFYLDRELAVEDEAFRRERGAQEPEHAASR